MIFDDDQRNYLDTNYMRCDKCQSKVEELEKREDYLDKAIAVLNTKLTWLIGILGTIGVAVLGIAVKLLLGVN